MNEISEISAAISSSLFNRASEQRAWERTRRERASLLSCVGEPLKRRVGPMVSMNLIRLTATVFVLVIASVSTVDATEWRGIIPMRSTREDVERLWGVPHMKSRHVYYYDFREEIAVVSFQSVSCEEACGPEWNVRLGTVLSVGVIPKQRHQRERFLKDQFKVEHTGGGFAYLTNEEEGLTVEEYNGAVTLISYSYARKDAPARCPQIRECIADPLFRFDEYGALSFADEKARLDNFGIQVKQSLARGAIVVYGRSQNVRAKLMIRAQRAKTYLVKALRFPALRVLVVDGGYRATSSTQLHLYPIHGSLGRMYFYPERDPGPAAPNKRSQRTRR